MLVFDLIAQVYYCDNHVQGFLLLIRTKEKSFQFKQGVSHEVFYSFFNTCN